MKVFKILSLALLFFPCALIAQDTQNDTKWETYERDKYVMSYPADWDLMALGGSFYSFILYSPQKGEGDEILEKIELQFEALDHLGENATLKQVVELIEDKRVIFTEVLSAEWTERNGQPCYETVYTHKIMSATSQRVKEYKWVKDNRLFMLSFAAPETTYDEYIPVAEKIMNSFTLR